MTDFFAGIPKLRYEGPDSTNPLAFRYYNPDEVVLGKPMKEHRSVALASRVADRVLAGARHRGVRRAQHFHTAGLRFPYNNMHYVLEAGGNEFYEKR